MLLIDDIKMEIINETLRVGKYLINGVLGYQIVIEFEFQNNGQRGYLNLYAGYEKGADIKNFVNREYKGIPFENNSEVSFFEIYDTEKFLDTEIESELTLQLKDLKNDRIEASFFLNDNYIKINYDGYLTLLKTIQN